MGALSLALEWENRLAVDEISKRHISNAQASQDTFLVSILSIIS
jgi:hypothetical protein